MTDASARRPASGPAPRPAHVGGAHTTDNGLFGPESLTWRLHAQHCMMLVGIGAATTQMLHPAVMRMIDQASHFREHPEARGQGTYQYIVTVTYGDTALAKQAGRTLRRIHQSVVAADPNTGVSYNAEVGELLLWVHNVLTLTAVRAFERYGPGLTAADADRYVAEQTIAAELVGIDPRLAASTVGELQDYMQQMLPRLGVIPESLWFREMMTSHGRGPAGWAEKIVKDAAIGLMLPEHRALFALAFPPRRDRAARRGAKALFALMEARAPVARAVPLLRRRVDTAAFGAGRAH